MSKVKMPKTHNTTVKYLHKDEMTGRYGPVYGYALPAEQTAYVRDDLPASVKAFVAEHERYHLIDSAKQWLWRELKANIYGARKQPWGFLVCLYMSVVSLDRWKYYFGRFERGK